MIGEFFVNIVDFWAEPLASLTMGILMVSAVIFTPFIFIAFMKDRWISEKTDIPVRVHIPQQIENNIVENPFFDVPANDNVFNG